jgi:hypothetical protein
MPQLTRDDLIRHRTLLRRWARTVGKMDYMDDITPGLSRADAKRTVMALYEDIDQLFTALAAQPAQPAQPSETSTPNGE